MNQITSNYRLLTNNEIQQLTAQHCICETWNTILVTQDFIADTILNVTFYGKNNLGIMKNTIDFSNGITKKSGIYNATLHNCTIGDNVYIRNVHNCISNYIIENDVIIDGINTLEVTENSSFGNGVLASVINEAGGREIPIYNELSAHEAYIFALYRYKPQLIKKLDVIVKNYIKSIRSPYGKVGEKTHISDCGIIRNVTIGKHAIINGVIRLQNGSVNSTKEGTSCVGAGVIADNFIFCSNSAVTDGVILNKCFVGQGTELSKQYSAENSVFFANCGGYHGEACSVFAGPYTVTHHKSTLLIAGLYSFMNAGSGSNQSNHMYKLGPVHQGILERGTKTTSNSYISYPARIGAFTLVMGRHTVHPDTTDFPFSYLVEKNDESVLLPGINIQSIGTVRDSKKWQARDKRTATVLFDYINFYLLNPYTVQKMIRGKEILENLQKTSSYAIDRIYYKRCRISKKALERGIFYYNLGIMRFIGNVFVSFLQRSNFETFNDLQTILKKNKIDTQETWIDLAGLIAPQNAISAVFQNVINNTIQNTVQLKNALYSIHAKYNEYEVIWAIHQFEIMLNKQITDITTQDFSTLLDEWINAVEILDTLRYEDAEKEYSQSAMLGFGIDGNAKEVLKDFTTLRGDKKNNTFMNTLQNQLELKKKTVEDLKLRLKKITN